MRKILGTVQRVPTSFVPAAQESADLSPYRQVADEIARLRRQQAEEPAMLVTKIISMAEASRRTPSRRARLSRVLRG